MIALVYHDSQIAVFSHFPLILFKKKRIYTCNYCLLHGAEHTNGVERRLMEVVETRASF